MSLEVLAACQNNNFCVLLSQVHYTGRLQQESLHMERFLALPEQLLHVERKLNQIMCLPTAQSHLLREQNDYNVPPILL